MRNTIKLLSNSPYKSQLAPLGLLSFFSLLIWYGGPLIAIANHIPLEQPEKRFYTIILLFLAWFLKIYFYDSKHVAKEAPTASPLEFKHPELAKKLEFLDGRFQGAINFLKKTLISKHGKDVSLYTLPWFLVVGPSNSGKTTLLANSNINFILSKQFKSDALKSIPPSDVCDWWVTRDAVLIDVPGFYLQSKQRATANTSSLGQTASLNHMLWKGFLDLIQKFRGHRAITGVLVTLPLPELMNTGAQGKERFIQDLKNRIADIREQFGEHVCFHFTITKCDLLPGFTDFFSDSGSDELGQAWGVTLPRLKENENINDLFTNRFNALIKRLNKQLIWRLHQERNPFVRPYIKDFPLQIERVKEAILLLLKALTTDNDGFHLQGIYLSSAMQQPPEESTSHIHAATSSTQSLQLMKNPHMPTRAYFVRQLLLQGILSGPEHSSGPTIPAWKRNPKRFAAVAAVLLIGAIFLAKDFHHSVNETVAIRDGLAQYQLEINQEGSHLVKALPLLNALQHTAINSSPTLLSYADKAQQSADAAYRQALRTIVLPEIKTALEKYLQSGGKNPEDYYAALEAYLMLGDKDHLQSDVITNTLKKIAPAVIDEANSIALSGHIRAAFNSAWQPIELNPEIIDQARKQLFNLTPVQLGFVLLKNIAANNLAAALSLGTNEGTSPALITKEIASQIPTMYTAAAFQSIYDREINTAATEISQGNWVLGSISTFNQQPTALINVLRTLYVANYVNAWEHLLNNIQLSSPTNLTQADALIVNLMGKNSPLLALLKTLKENTSFPPIIAASPKLAGLDGLLVADNEQQSSGLSRILTSLQEVHVYIQNILASKGAVRNLRDPVPQLRNLADQSPEPVRTWLSKIAAQTLHFAFLEAHLNIPNIETHPHVDIMSTYHTQLTRAKNVLNSQEAGMQPTS